MRKHIFPISRPTFIFQGKKTFCLLTCFERGTKTKFPGSSTAVHESNSNMVLGKYFTAKNIEDSARTFSLMLSIFMNETKETTENVDL